MTKIYTRSEILASAGIKPIELPPGWMLLGNPIRAVAPKQRKPRDER